MLKVTLLLQYVVQFGGGVLFFSDQHTRLGIHQNSVVS